MKKVICLVLAVLLAAVALASCSAGVLMERLHKNVASSTTEEQAYEREEGAIVMDEAPGSATVPTEFYYEEESFESYIPIEENTEKPTDKDSLVTFSLKVDTASYSNVARYIDSGQLPPADAVRVEELVNYFSYNTPEEFGEHPLSLYTEVAQNPFDPQKYTAFIRVKSRNIDRSELPASNLVFLIDSSGSMDSYDKLPLLQKAFSLLAETLDERDRVSIVTYAGSSEVILSGARGDETEKITEAINSLWAGGSTAGAEGISTAYELAEEYYLEDGNNRVILATDGDFNVGLSSVEELADFIGEKRQSGVYLSTLGFGTDNLKDDIMETLSKDGNGNYSYIDSARTAKKVLVDELGSNLFTIADDVKAQVEFNPANVKSYRLIGYENRTLDNEDFDDDKKDAGEIGVDTDVVALFELTLNDSGGGGGLKYGANTSKPSQTDFSEYGDELFEVRIRYKNPGETESKLILSPATFDDISEGGEDFSFACSVAEFGKLLRGSDFAAGGIDEIIDVASENIAEDDGAYRTEFLALLRRCKKLN